MRADMQKVLTERPRTKSWEERRKTAGKVRIADLNEDLDDEREVSRVPTSRRRVYQDYKEFTDHIMPLKRYLKSQVGRLWNDVWSDMCAVLDRRSTTGNHVFEHIRWEVELNTVMVDGKVHHYIGGSGVTGPVTGLYVHPTTGILCRAPERDFGFRRRKADANKIRLDQGLYLICLDGIWYEAHYERFETRPLLLDLKEYWQHNYRVIEETERWTWEERKLIGNRVHYFQRHERTVYYVVRHKRQLSSKELRRHGLSNAATLA
jgi:hypothetical protein